MTRVLALDPELGAALAGLGCDVVPGPLDLADVDVVATGPAWSTLRAWRVAGHTTPALVRAGPSGLPEERASLEPLAVVTTLEPDALRAALVALEAGRARGVLRVGGARVELGRRQVWRDGRVERLTAREVDLLAYLAARPGREVSRDELLVQVWGHPTARSTRAVDMAVLRLRSKIEADPSRPTSLLSSYGGGYCLVVDEGPATRSALVAALERALGAPGVVTLVGPAGVGKTWIAEQIPGARWVHLASARSGPDVDARVAAALGVAMGEADDLGPALEASPAAVVVLDSAEHVRDALRERLARWVGRTWLVTSQAPLELAGERVLQVPPLEPEEARRLYVSCSGDPSLAQDPALAELLARLDHLPLAVRLAAGRAHVLRPTAMLQAFEPALVGDPSAGDARHRSLRRALEWTWSWLEDRDRDALARWSAFRGAFDIPAAAAVAERPAPDAIEVLERAVVRGMVVRAGPGFSLLESVRDAARELGPSEASAGTRAHRRWVEARAAEALAALDGPEPAGWRDRLVALAPELTAAAERGAGVEVHLALDAALAAVGTARERVRALDRALERAPDPRLHLARAGAGRSVSPPERVLADFEIARAGLDGRARERACAQLAHWLSSRGDREGARASLVGVDGPLARSWRVHLDPPADPLPDLLAAAAEAEQAGDPHSAWEILLLAHAAAGHRGRWEAERAVFLALSALADTLGEEAHRALVAMFEAELLVNADRLAEAREALARAIPYFERAGRLDARRRAQESLVQILLHLGLGAEARVEIARLEGMHAARGSALGQGWARLGLAALLLDEGRYADLAREAETLAELGAREGSGFLRQRGLLFGALAALGVGSAVNLPDQAWAGSNGLLRAIVGAWTGDPRSAARALVEGTGPHTPSASDWLHLAEALEGRPEGLIARVIDARPSHVLARGVGRLWLRTYGAPQGPPRAPMSEREPSASVSEGSPASTSGEAAPSAKSTS